MPIVKLDAEKCRERNTLTALKGRNAVPVRLLLAPPTPVATSARGSLPKDETEALSRINTMLGREGDDAIKPEDVYLLYPEVGNTNYIGDRYMFMGRRTLRNIADTAGDGFAFMNSHRTGGMSQPTELPYGRTFCGRFEMGTAETGEKAARTIVGAYMLRGQLPNGANGPTTDDLYSGIAGGTIFDVSLGLYGGVCVCDVCGEELHAYDSEEGRYLCPHVPGTFRKMSPEQVDTQKARGVPGGVASYTLEDANAAEFSAVFDGAVPGAGFRKAVRLARKGQLSTRSLTQANHAYRSLLTPSGDGRRAGRFFLRLKGQPMPFSLADLFGKIKVSPEDAASFGVTDLDDDEDIPPARIKPAKAKLSETQAPEPDPQLSARMQQLEKDLAAERDARATEKAERDAERKTELAARIKDDAKAFANKVVADNKLMGQTAELATLYAYINLSVAGLPTDGLQPVKALERFTSAIPPHNLRSEALPKERDPENIFALDNHARGGSGDNGKMGDARKIELLSHYPEGAAIIAAMARNGTA